jgi:protein-L-isoaspartate(D-aspartate) O-methyltransferase
MHDCLELLRQYENERRRMVHEQLLTRGIRDQRVLDAMDRMPRELFVPPDLVQFAYEDRALPIAAGQTISQPLIVAYMTEQLDVRPDSRVLEIGTGSGYQTAILASLARHVYSVERIAELRQQAERTLSFLEFHNITFHTGDGTMGLRQFAPYDRIMVTAAAPSVPQSLVDQLVGGGRMVLPVGGAAEQTITRVDKIGDRVTEIPRLACRFVKLIGEEGWREVSNWE